MRHDIVDRNFDIMDRSKFVPGERRVEFNAAPRSLEHIERHAGDFADFLYDNMNRISLEHTLRCILDKFSDDRAELHRMKARRANEKSNS